MKEKGYITVYLSLVLIVILAVLFTTLESARISGSRMRYQVITLLGLESIFADYYTPLLKEYGLLFLNSSYQTDNRNEYENRLNQYIEYNLYPNKELLLKGNNLYRSTIKSIDILESTLATDYSGDVMEEELINYMEYAMPADSVMWILEKAGLVDESKVVKKFFDDLSDIHGKAEKVDKTVHSISELVLKIRTSEDDFTENADGLKEKLLDLEELYNMETMAESDEELARYHNKIISVESSVRKNLNSILKEQKKLNSQTKSAVKKEEEYKKWTERFMEDLSLVEADIHEDFADLSNEMQGSILEEIESMKIFSGGQSDYYEVEEVGKLLKANESILETNIQSLSSFQGSISEGDIGSLISTLEQCKSSMGRYNKENLKINYNDEELENNNGNLLEEIARLVEDGIYSLVIPGELEVSKKEIPCEGLLSLDMPKGNSKKEVLLEVVGRTLLTNEYVIKKFGNILDVKEEKALDYEVEYILAGNASDQENLKEIINKLLGIREGMNLMYLFSDSGKKQEAEMLAISLVGFTGMYGLIKVTQLLILAAWAFVESIIDIKELLAGNAVELVKNSRDWKMSLSGFIEFFSNGSSKEGLQTNTKKGLKYVDYLRLLLLSEKRETKLYRIMDLIQENIRKSYDVKFYMKNCIYSLEVVATYGTEPMFLAIPFMKGYVGNGQRYEFSIKKAYSYK